MDTPTTVLCYREIEWQVILFQFSLLSNQKVKNWDMKWSNGNRHQVSSYTLMFSSFKFYFVEWERINTETRWLGHYPLVWATKGTTPCGRLSYTNTEEWRDSIFFVLKDISTHSGECHIVSQKYGTPWTVQKQQTHLSVVNQDH